MKQEALLQAIQALYITIAVFGGIISVLLVGLGVTAYFQWRIIKLVREMMREFVKAMFDNTDETMAELCKSERRILKEVRTMIQRFMQQRKQEFSVLFSYLF